MWLIWLFLFPLLIVAGVAYLFALVLLAILWVMKELILSVAHAVEGWQS